MSGPFEDAEARSLEEPEWIYYCDSCQKEIGDCRCKVPTITNEKPVRDWDNERKAKKEMRNV